MELKHVSDSCFAVLNEKNRVCDANSGLINRGGGVVIDTQSDLGHARQMIDLFGKVWTARPKRVINTHEDADHVWGNQLFADAEIIAHRSVPKRMEQVANPEETQKLLHGAGRFLTRLLLEALHPGLAADGEAAAEPLAGTRAAAEVPRVTRVPHGPAQDLEEKLAM
jgi:cyclase